MKKVSTSASITETTPESKRKSETSSVESGVATPSLAYVQPLPPSNAANAASRTYLRDAAEHLLTWMNRMQGEDVTAQNVNAVCNLAQQMANIVKTNIELKKAGL